MEKCKIPKTIIVADEDDRLLINEAFNNSCQCFNLQIVGDGEELLEVLHNKGKNPDLILLDLNMPRMDGFEVLESIKGDPQLKKIPVIIFTTTDEQSALAKTYCNGANSFIRKPATFEQLSHIVKVIASYWCEIVLLPDGFNCPPEESA